MTDYTTAEAWADSLGYNEIAVHEGGKRCGVQWTPWMGDWFTSWSPRNDNNNSEGHWDHWVDLAIQILADPLTKIVRPGVHQVVIEANLEPLNLYDGAARKLTYEELMARLREPGATAADEVPDA